MTSYRKLILFVLIFLLVGGGLAVWNADQKMKREEEQRRRDAVAQNSPSMTGKNASFTVTEGKVKKWKLEAKTATYSEDKAQADLTVVRGEFYDKTGKPILEFTAPKGKYLTKNNTVSLSGGVVAKSIEGEGQEGKAGQLQAPTMTWNAKSDLVHATGGVKLDFPQGKSTAQTCKFTLDFSNISLEGGVTSAISN